MKPVKKLDVNIMDLKEFKKSPKLELVKTSIALTPEQHAWIKSQNLEFSEVVRAFVDSLMRGEK